MEDEIIKGKLYCILIAKLLLSLTDDWLMLLQHYSFWQLAKVQNYLRFKISNRLNDCAPYSFRWIVVVVLAF